jgi:hypothetical protein
MPKRPSLASRTRHSGNGHSAHTRGQVAGGHGYPAETGQSLHTNDPSQPTYTGKSTFWAGANLNSQNNFTATVTFSFHAKGSDGSRITGHGVAHVTLHADGTVTVEFDRFRLSCP